MDLENCCNWSLLDFLLFINLLTKKFYLDGHYGEIITVRKILNEWKAKSLWFTTFLKSSCWNFTRRWCEAVKQYLISVVWMGYLVRSGLMMHDSLKTAPFHLLYLYPNHYPQPGSSEVVVNYDLQSVITIKLFLADVSFTTPAVIAHHETRGEAFSFQWNSSKCCISYDYSNVWYFPICLLTHLTHVVLIYILYQLQFFLGQMPKLSMKYYPTNH